MQNDRQEELTFFLRQAADDYYNGRPTKLSDKEYDQLFDELLALEQKSGIILEGSPTAFVGAVPEENLKKVRHRFPALSLDKTKDIIEFTEKFSSDSHSAAGIVLMWKLDGSTVQLSYLNGKLQTAATRGNGEIGQDITHNARFIKGIPYHISFMGDLVVRGEATMTYQEFSRINEALPDTAAQYANPRNLANATISMLDSREMRKREICFHAFDLVYASEFPSEMIESSFSARFTWLKELGFSVVQYIVCKPKELAMEMQTWSERVSEYDTPVDGLVAAEDDILYTQRLAGTAHHPNPLRGYAFKWADETADTKLLKIEWSASRTGLLNPVAIFTPVELEGTTVSRASLHNVSYIQEMDLRPGDSISVYKANKIIPQIAGNNTVHDTPFSLPKVACPSCGQDADIMSHNGVLTMHCKNPDCPAKQIGRFVHFCSRDGMNIVGISEQIIEKLVSRGLVREYSDFYHLYSSRDEIASWEGFGEKSVKNLLQSIEISRNTSFTPFITALGIPGIGKGQARLLSRSFDGNIEKFLYATIPYDFTRIDGFGEKLSASLNQWLTERIPTEGNSAPFNPELIHLLPELHFSKEEVESIGGPFSGKTFVITGSLESFLNRDECKAWITSNGGKVTGSVSAKTDYLVNNDITSTSGKNKKAAQLQIPVITEMQLREMAET